MKTVLEKFAENKRNIHSFTEKSVVASLVDKLSADEIAVVIKELKTNESQSMGKQKQLSEVFYCMSKKDLSDYKKLKFDTYEDYLWHYTKRGL